MHILRRAGRKVTIDVVDDLDGTTAEETVTFALDGEKYQIDLTKPNADALRRTLQPYIDRARVDGFRR
jgi:hypothetical protein